MAPPGHGQSDAADATERMRMHDLHVRLFPERADQIEGHEVPADRYPLLPTFFRQTPHRHAGAKALDGVACGLERIWRVTLRARTKDYWRDALRCEAVKEPLQRRFGSTPFR